jgi:hypothetical protein
MRAPERPEIDAGSLLFFPATATFILRRRHGYNSAFIAARS